MLQFPLWKKLIVVAICVVGFAIALPNLFYNRVEASNDAEAALARGVAASSGGEAALAGWPRWLPHGLVNLGLDLRGGAYVLVEVETQQVHAERLEGLWPDLRDKLRDLRAQVGPVRRLEGGPDALRVRIGDASGMDQALQAVVDVSRPVFSLTGAGSRDFVATSDGDVLVVTLSDPEKQAVDERTMQQSLEIIRRRVDETGTP